jgi:hypothetical protein
MTSGKTIHTPSHLEPHEIHHAQFFLAVFTDEALIPVQTTQEHFSKLLRWNIV